MDAQLSNEDEKAALPETLAHVNPNSADMDANPPARETVVDDAKLSEASSADAVSSTLNSRENEAAHGLAVAAETKGEDETIHEDHSTLKEDAPVDAKKEVAEARPQPEDGERQNVEAATSHEAMEACLHTPQYENAEITLVVEMNTDAEMMVESGVKGEEIMQAEADPSLQGGALLQVVEQVGASICKEEGRDNGPAVIPEHTETGVTEDIPQEKMGKVQTPDRQIGQKEPADSTMHDIDVETMNLACDDGFSDGLFSEDKAKGVPREVEQVYVHAEAQIRRDAEKSCLGEDASTFTGPLEAKAEGEVSRLPDAVEGVENDEAESRGGEALGGCIEGVIEEGDAEKGRKVVDAEMEADTQPCINEVSAGMTEGEQEKDGTVERELAGSSSVAEDMVDVIRMEKESGSTTLQLELGTTNISSENEDVQVGPPENSSGRDGVVEGIEKAEGTVVPTEAMRNKEVKKVEEPGEWSSTPIGMDADTDKQRMDVDVFQHMESDPGERAKEGVQEMRRETEAHTSNVAPLQHPMDVGMVPQSGIMEDESRQVLERNNESGKEVGAEMLADHIALQSNKHMVEAVDVNKYEHGGQRKEAPRQDLQGSIPVIQGPIENLKSKNLAFETNHSEGDRKAQWERQQNRHVHAEMQIRLLPDKSVRADLIKSHEVLEGGSGMRMIKELPFAKSKEAQDEEPGASVGQHWRVGIVMQVKTKADLPMEERPKDTKMREIGFEKHEGWAFQGPGYENAAHGISRGGRAGMFEEEKTGMSDEANTGTSEEEKYLRAGFAKGDIIEKASQKRKLSDNLASDSGTMNEHGQNDNVVKKAKKKAVNVWAKSSTRKGPKKNSKNGAPQNPSNEDSVLLTPVYVNPDKLEDGPDQPIALSKHDKAEKIELSENRLSASSTKGYRMVRATRGVQEGAWYFEIVVEQLGPTGHTRLGWSTQKGDVQAPVGFDSNSYGYRDLDGSKTHVAIREPYGDLYVEGDVIGFYINLPNGAEYAPKPAPLISYRGRPYLSDIKEEQPRRVPGSEICFFRNGVCQGTAFRDINAGRYFPAASMYTLPKEPSCIVRFNFGPEFRFPPVDIGERTPPLPMVQAPYHDAFSGKEVGKVAWANASAPGNASLSTEPQMKIV